MALGLNYESTGGDFESKPYVNYDSRAGRITAVERIQNAAGAWEQSKADITNNFAMVFDLASIQVGWIEFSAQGPKKALVPLGQPLPAKPSPEHKQGYLLNIYSKALGVREFSSVAKVALAGMDALHTAYEAAPESKQGMLPVVALSTVRPIETEFTNKQGQRQKNTNYEPVWGIVKWVPRPPAMPPLSAQPVATLAPSQPTPPPRAAQPVPAPPPVAPVAPPVVDEDPFA